MSLNFGPIVKIDNYDKMSMTVLILSCSEVGNSALFGSWVVLAWHFVTISGYCFTSLCMHLSWFFVHNFGIIVNLKLMSSSDFVDMV